MGVLAAALSLGAAGPPPPVVTDAFARATAPGQDTGGVFLTLTSPGGDTLTGATSPAARAVSLHRMAMNGPVMVMRPLASVELPAGRPVRLAPGSMHLMLEGLRAPLRRGQVVHLTLALTRAGALAIDVPVAGPGARAP